MARLEREREVPLTGRIERRLPSQAGTEQLSQNSRKHALPVVGNEQNP